MRDEKEMVRAVPSRTERPHGRIKPWRPDFPSAPNEPADNHAEADETEDYEHDQGERPYGCVFLDAAIGGFTDSHVAQVYRAG